MTIRPVLRSHRYPRQATPNLPLTLIIPLNDGVEFNHIPSALLAVIVAAAGRGLIYNNLSAEYGRGLQFWIDYNEPIGRTNTDVVMMEFEEAFESMVTVLNEWSDYLSIYSDLDHLLVRLRRYDPTDRSFALSITDG